MENRLTLLTTEAQAQTANASAHVQQLQNAAEQQIQERESIINQLRSEVGRIAAVTEFNGISLTDGTTGSLSVQVGIQNASSSRIDISLGNITTSGLSINAISLDSVTNARGAIDSLDTALTSVNGFRSSFGAVQNRLDSALNNSQIYVESLSSAASQIMDTDFATETSNLTKLQIMQQAGVASLAQAKNINQSVISLLG